MTEVDAPATEHDVEQLVSHFYARARHDPLLGSVFAQAVGESEEAWGVHLLRVTAFWSSLVLHTGRYQGDPFSVHVKLPILTPEMFDRWLSLFSESCSEVFAPDLAAIFCTRAERVARSLRLGLSARLAAR
jgi:hemoglobin